MPLHHKNGFPQLDRILGCWSRQHGVSCSHVQREAIGSRTHRSPLVVRECRSVGGTLRHQSDPSFSSRMLMLFERPWVWTEVLPWASCGGAGGFHESEQILAAVRGAGGFWSSASNKLPHFEQQGFRVLGPTFLTLKFGTRHLGNTLEGKYSYCVNHDLNWARKISLLLHKVLLEQI